MKCEDELCAFRKQFNLSKKDVGKAIVSI